MNNLSKQDLEDAINAIKNMIVENKNAKPTTVLFRPCDVKGETMDDKVQTIKNIIARSDR